MQRSSWIWPSEKDSSQAKKEVLAPTLLVLMRKKASDVGPMQNCGSEMVRAGERGMDTGTPTDDIGNTFVD